MKPFPWKCGTCRGRALAPAVVDYEAEVEHDGRAYKVRIPGLQVLRCGNCGALVLDDEANRKVSNALRAEAGLLTPEQIRRQREELGLTQKQLADALQVGESTLSRWETGGQIQQRSLDRLLRVFFAVPEVRRFLGMGDGGQRKPIPAQRLGRKSGVGGKKASSEPGTGKRHKP